MSKPKISIIMPVYQVEKYVAKAIESIQKQTLSDWEFLIVDDGSLDDSGKICDEYAKNDSRIHVIHKENGGAPSARNVAIDIATGKYLYFMDSDDWAEPTMLEDMYCLAEKNYSQLVVAGFYIDTYYNDTEKYTQQQYSEDKVFYSKKDFRKEAYRFFDKNLLYTPWNKLYLASYIQKNKFYFPQTFWDDFPFNLSIIRDVERVCMTSKCYYHFIRQRSESETAKYRRNMYEKREEEHKWMLDLYNYWNVHNEASKEFLARRYVERIVGCVENVTNSSCNLSVAEKKASIRKMIRNPYAALAAKIAKPKSRYMQLMVLPIKWRNIQLTYLEGCTISKVKSKNIKLFAKLKANR